MKKQIFVVLLFFSISYGKDVGIYKPILKNLPKEYSSVLWSFFLNNFHNVEPYSKKNRYTYTVKPTFSSIGGSYNVCFDIFENNKITRVLCSSAEDGRQLFERLLYLTKKSGIFQLKKQLKEEEIYLKVLAFSGRFKSKMKVISHNGDVLIGYITAKKFQGQQVSHITVGNGIINIDTIILNGVEASKVLEYILNGYRFKGILIIAAK